MKFKSFFYLLISLVIIGLIITCIYVERKMKLNKEKSMKVWETRIEMYSKKDSLLLKEKNILKDIKN